VLPANKLAMVKRRFMQSGSERVWPPAGIILGSLLFLLALIGSGGGALAAEADNIYCDSLLQRGAQNKIPNQYLVSPDLGRKVQEGLATIFADDPAFPAGSDEKALLHDNRIGRVSRRWLKRFCVDYPMYATADSVSGAVMESALHYAEIAQRHPDWRATLTSPEFEAWMQDGLSADQNETRQIRRSGAAPVVSSLLDEFVGSRSETTGMTPSAAEASCEQMRQPGFKTRSARLSPKSRVIGKNIQQGLQAVFAGNPEYDSERRGQTDLLFDGRVGRQTRKWMARFCQDFPIAGSPESLPDNVVLSLLHYAAIAAVHADWREIVKDPEFNQWIVQPVPKEEPDNRPLRLSGSAPIVNQLIVQYLRGEKPPPPVPPTECSEETPHGAAVYYQLSEQDLQQLQERDLFLGQLEKLVGKKFDSEEALVTEIGPTADRLGNKCVRQKFLQTLQGGINNPTTEYRLTSDSLDRLRDQLTSPGQTGEAGDIRFAANAMSVIEQLQEKRFPSKSRLAQFVRFELKLLMADETVPATDVVSTPPPPAIEDANPPNSAEKTKIEEKPEADKPEKAKFKGFKFAGYEDEPKEEKPAEEKPEKEKPEEEKPAEAKPKEEGAAAAPPVASAAQPAQESPRAAVKIDPLVKQIVALAESRLWSYEVTGKALDVLKEEKLFRPVPESDLAAIEPLEDVAYISAELYATALRSALGSGPNSGESVPAIVQQARKIGDSSMSLDVSAADNCGCNRPWDMVGKNHFTVYGFYPSWLPTAVAEKIEPQAESAEPADKALPVKTSAIQLDFGLFNRLGYFALELDEEGKIIDRRQWSEEHGAGRFIQLAHKYLSKVDLVIEARHWQRWNEKALAQAVAEIWSLLNPNSPNLPTGMIPDGVTIYFPGFAHSEPGKHQRIVTLLTQLHGKIHSAEENSRRNTLVGYLPTQLGGQDNAPSLNILIGADTLDLDPLNPNKRLLGNLKFLGGLKDVLVGDEQIVDLVLVLLGQPVVEVKKKLRLAIENEFQGEERISVLRRIVPVIPPNGHKEQERAAVSAKWGSSDDPYRQLHHDLFYFRDNFRGVAFWPLLPVAAEAQELLQTDEVKERLIGVFSQSEAPAKDSWINSLLGQDPCLFVCPNRWYLKVLFFTLLGGLILLAVLAYWSCRIKSFVVKSMLPVLLLVGLLILMFVAFITCVPTWEDRQTSTLQTLLVLLLGSWVFYYIRKVKQGPLP